MPRFAAPLRRGWLDAIPGTSGIELPFIFGGQARLVGERIMAKVVYTVVEHDGGWAYTVDGVFSETFRSRDDAHAAAEIAAAEQRRAGDAAPIEYQSADGKWHVEGAPGDDRPATDVED